MKSTVGFLLLVILVISSCKDTKQEPQLPQDEPTVQKMFTQAQADSIKQKRKLDKLYKRAVTSSGDTLLPYIMQDSVEVFFTRYGKENPETVVRMSTSFGDIDIELFEETPLYRASFIFLIKNGYFDETVVHRTMPKFIVQAGNSDNKITATKKGSAGNYQLKPHIMPHIKHGYGTVSSAKYWENNPENWHNPFDFFISLRATEHLDGEHTIFGRVIKGMDVAEKISQVPTDSREWPINDIYIEMSVIR